MMHQPRSFRPFAILGALAVGLTSSIAAQTAEEVFERGVRELWRGEKEQLAETLHELLGMEPSQSTAYELWKNTEHDIWIQLLSMGGEVELDTKRLIDLASEGRNELSRDADTIRATVAEVTSSDALVRQRAVQRLSSQHGEFAVPYMVHALGDKQRSDRRVLMMQALTRMGSSVLQPLIASLRAPDVYLRRNVALTLGYIGDARARGALAQRAFLDEDSGVRNAASQSLQRCGGTSDVVEQFLTLGDAYYAERGSVLPPNAISTVVWAWKGTNLESMPIPRFLYAPELARRAYEGALAASVESVRARAGLVRCLVAQAGRLAEWGERGVDDAGWAERVEADQLIVRFAGTDALELALAQALDDGDGIAAAGLCRALGAMATAPTPALLRALESDLPRSIDFVGGATLRGEAAIALAALGDTSRATLAALAEAVGREALRSAAVIDGDAARAASVAQALRSSGFETSTWGTGIAGLVALRRAPGVDVVVIAERLPDITLNEVLYELRRDPSTSEAPVVVLAESSGAEGFDEEAASGLAESIGVAGVFASSADVDAVEAAVRGGIGRDREQANRLSAQAAEALARLAGRGVDLGSSGRALASVLAHRPEEVSAPVLATLERVGRSEDVAGITALLTDAKRGEEIRIRAAAALAGIFGRTGSADGPTLTALRAVALQDDSPAIRSGTALALGRLSLTDEMRADLIRGVHEN